jgi:hypothetical protein
MSALSAQPRKGWHDVVFTRAADDPHAPESRIMTA